MQDHSTQHNQELAFWKGLTLKKEDNPQRYTLTDMTFKSFISKEEGDATKLVKKERTMSELTDNDVYTFIDSNI